MMMEVQRLACLSPTQRLSAHLPPSSLRQPSSSALNLPYTSSAISLPSTMIIESSLHASATTPPDSPQQGETVPNGVSEELDTDYTLPAETENEKSLSHRFQKQETEAHPLWSQGADMANGVDEFSQGGMAREGVEEGSAESPTQPSPGEQEELSGCGQRDHVQDAKAYYAAHGSDDCYMPSMHAASSNPTCPETGDRRNRRKQTIEDIVRRIATSEPEDAYHSEELDEEGDANMEMDMSRTPLTDDEVDGTPLPISHQILNAQACAESTIKQSMRTHFDDSEDNEDEAERSDCFTPVNFLHLARKDLDGFSRPPNHPWEDSKAGSLDSECMESAEKKAGVTVLPKNSFPPHLSPSLTGGLLSSLPLSNISETAYSPHHFSSAKMNNGWYPSTMHHHLFPFSPGLMDHSMGPKFLSFEGKLMSDVDKDYLKCNYCERTFRRQKNLENHIENTHQGKGGQRPKREHSDMYFKCTHCPYTTKHQSNLYVHLRIHTGERPYICGACGVQYSQSHSLKSHIINKHDGHMNYYIKEKRNRSPRGLGYMSTHVNPGDHTIFKIPPPPLQNNIDLAVARAIEMAKTGLGDVQAPPPSLLQSVSSSMQQHGSPLMSPGAGHHNMFPKPGPGFPFNGPFSSPGITFGDLPANPAPAMIPQPSPGNHLHSPGNHLPSPGNHLPNGTSGVPSSATGSRNEMLNLSTPTLTSTPGFRSSANSSLLSPGLPSKPQPSPNSQHSPGSNKTGTDSNCGAMDLSTRGGGQDVKGRTGSAARDCSSCINCPQSNKLKLLRLNVVRMLSILVPNLNFEEKGISADSDSVDELLQDVIESNTHDDDMMH